MSILGQRPCALDHILRPDALQFLARLEQRFRNTRRELLERRNQRQASLDGGLLPRFLSETKEVREGSWKIAPCPKDLQNRKVEITAPVDRKMVINALNSGANVFMADFEDSHSPHWLATIDGQANLFDAVRKTIEYVSPEGKRYQLKTATATLMVRPRGWHLDEKHVRLDGKPIAASLFDFGLFFYHNAQELIKRGSGPYFYLPKLESHLEARLWNDVFVFAQKDLGIPVGTIKATVLIETILAAFEMHEILFELRDHSAGLNCGRWDYIFSFIKKLRNHHDRALPNRHQITMGSHFLKSYSELLIQTCHRRGAHAIGGMAAQIPIRNDASANASALEKVRADKLREVRAGHDGTWVAHPDLVSIASEVFDAYIQGPNQLHVERNEIQITPADLLSIPQGTITAEGLQNNISVGVQYLAAWLGGNGCVPLYHLMEDAATAEIARAQVWQWIRRQATLEDGRQVDATLFREMLATELKTLRKNVKSAAQPIHQLDLAAEIFDSISTSASFCEFLTIPAYNYIIEKRAK